MSVVAVNLKSIKRLSSREMLCCAVSLTQAASLAPFCHTSPCLLTHSLLPVTFISHLFIFGADLVSFLSGLLYMPITLRLPTSLCLMFFSFPVKVQFPLLTFELIWIGFIQI